MIQRRETGGAGKGEQSGCLGRPDDLPCHGEEMRLTQKYTEGLFLEILSQHTTESECNQGGAGLTKADVKEKEEDALGMMFLLCP